MGRVCDNCRKDGVAVTIISLDYEKVVMEVKRLKTVAGELQTLQTNAQNALKDMNSYWEGSAASAFLSANKNWRSEMQAIQNEINSIAGLIQKVADEIREAEARAREAIRNASILK